MLKGSWCGVCIKKTGIGCRDPERNFLLNQPYGLVDALDGDDSIGVINEPNEGPYFGSRIFPSIGLPTADGA